MWANRSWSLSRGCIREFLYGKPAWTRTDAAAEVPWEACLSQDKEPCLFKDPLYESLLGLMMVERDPLEPLKLTGRAYSNPFGKRALLEGEQPLALLRESGREPDGAVRVSWSVFFKSSRRESGLFFHSLKQRKGALWMRERLFSVAGTLGVPPWAATGFPH